MKDTQDSGGTRHVISFQDLGQDIIHLATNYASDYLDYVENLPFDLQRSVTKLREVDQKCQEHVKEMEQLYENFRKELEGAQGIPRRSYLLQIRRLFGICKELGDEKISIVQSISEAIEIRNKQLEHGCRRFKYAYEPSVKMEHGKKEKDSKSDSSRVTKRSRRQRNNNSSDGKDKNPSLCTKDVEKLSKVSYDDTDEPPAKVMLPSLSSDHSSPASASAPALTRAALREEDKRLKDKKEDRQGKDADQASTTANLGKNPDSTTATTSSTATTPATTSSVSNSKTKNNTSVAVSSSSTTAKTNTKGKKKKRKSNKIEKQASASGEASPVIDMPIDPDEPTYCICQQVSFGQMIGCDNLKCPIEWFHFSCVRLTHKPKGKWYCPDCTIKRKREGKKADSR